MPPILNTLCFKVHSIPYHAIGTRCADITADLSPYVLAMPATEQLASAQQAVTTACGCGTWWQVLLAYHTCQLYVYGNNYIVVHCYFILEIVNE